MSEFPAIPAPYLSEEGVSSLSDVLEAGEILPKYFLSRAACRGILHRAAKRGKTLPSKLETALREVAATLAEGAKSES